MEPPLTTTRWCWPDGGDLFIPPIDGIYNQGVFSCKQFHETLKLRSHKGTRAVVIGSGAIGIEAAEALKKQGYEVTIIELLGWILPALFDEVTSKRLEAAMESYGIHVHTGEKVMRINGDQTVTGVTTDRTRNPLRHGGRGHRCGSGRGPGPDRLVLPRNAASRSIGTMQHLGARHLCLWRLR